MPARAAKRQKLKFDLRTPSPDSDEAESSTRPNILFRNTTLASPGRSRQGVTTYLPAHVSPTKSGRNREEVQWNVEAPEVAPSSPGEIDMGEYPFLDPAYVQQCDMNHPGHKQRRTNASVGLKLLKRTVSY